LGIGSRDGDSVVFHPFIQNQNFVRIVVPGKILFNGF